MDTSKATGSVTGLIECLKAGDADAAAALWERYFPRLVALARKKLQNGARRVADEEDAALAAFDSFCRRAGKGQFPDLKDRDGLWALLVVLTARKVYDLHRHDNTQRRGGGHVHGDSALADREDTGPGFDGLAGTDPSPEEAAILAEAVENLLDRLPDRAIRQVAVWKLEGYTNAEIAAMRGCSLPTVERQLAMIRRLLRPG